MMTFKTVKLKSTGEFISIYLNDLFTCEQPHLLPLSFDLDEFKSELKRNPKEDSITPDSILEDLYVVLVKIEIFDVVSVK